MIRSRGEDPFAWIPEELKSAVAARSTPDRVGRSLSTEVAVRYRRQWGAGKVIDEFQFGPFSYLFDSSPEGRTNPSEPANRVLAAWGLSQPDAIFGDRRNLRRFPVPPVSERFDRGHLIAMSVGGGDYVNLVPQDSQLNRGLSEAGKRWRSLERAVAADAGALAFVAVHYNGLTDIPDWFGYAVVHTNNNIRFEAFRNRS